LEEKPCDPLTDAPNNNRNGRPRGSRHKTIRIRTLLTLMLAACIINVIIFIFLYYQSGKRFSDTGLPFVSAVPPDFLYNIYEGKNKFQHPIAVAVYSDGRIFVSNNRNHTVETVLPNGNPGIAFGGSGESEGLMLYPYGVDFLPGGNLLVAETGNYRVQEYTRTGKYVRTFIPKNNKFGLEKPGPIKVDSKGRIYIGDLSGNCVFVLNRAGKLLRKIENISYPHGIAIDEKNQRLYVSDAGQAVIKVFPLNKASGKPQQVIGQVTGDGVGFSVIRGLEVDNLGRLYVVDSLAGVVRVFDKKGQYLFSFGGQGFEDGQFLYPNGIYADDTGKIYVADWGHDRVQVWGYRK